MKMRCLEKTLRMEHENRFRVKTFENFLKNFQKHASSMLFICSYFQVLAVDLHAVVWKLLQCWLAEGWVAVGKKSTITVKSRVPTLSIKSLRLNGRFFLPHVAHFSIFYSFHTTLVWEKSRYILFRAPNAIRQQAVYCCTFVNPTNQIKKVCPYIWEFSWNLFVF